MAQKKILHAGCFLDDTILSINGNFDELYSPLEIVELSGEQNGVNTDFLISGDEEIKGEVLYLNGLRQKREFDYLVTLPNKISFFIAPLATDLILMEM